MNPTVDFALAIAGLIAFALVVWLVFRSARRRLDLKPGSMILAIMAALLLQPLKIQAVVDQYMQFVIQLPAWLGQIKAPQQALVPLIYSKTLWYHGMLVLLLVLVLAWFIEQVRLWFEKPADQKPPYIEQNTLTIVTVLAAVYLSVGALMAAPLARQITPTTTNVLRDELRAELDLLSDADSVIAVQFKATINRNNQLIVNLADDNRFDLLLIENASLNYELRNTFRSVLPSMQQLALARMKQTDDANLVKSLKLFNKRALLQWYKENRNNMVGYLEQRIDLVTQLLKDMNAAALPMPAHMLPLLEGKAARQGTAQPVIDHTDTLLFDNDDGHGLDTLILPSGVESANHNQPAVLANDSIMQGITEKYGANALKLTRPDLTKLPQRPKPGDHLGVFNKLMGWMFRIESFSAIIIMGLVGFGLLGATGATFIREHGKSMADRDRGPLVRDLPNLLIKGISAALVVFLGVLGSVSLLSNEGNADQVPDADLLFFLALVAAVFSDTAWDWAKARFQKTLQDQDNTLQAEGKVAPDNSPAQGTNPDNN